VADRLRSQPAGAAAAAEPLARLAQVLDEAFYAAEEPDEPAARRAWELTLATGRALRGDGGVRARVLTAVDPRPLLPGRR
jgi:hypothetical protein